jgi:hypothetical protein
MRQTHKTERTRQMAFAYAHFAIEHWIDGLLAFNRMGSF